MATLSIPYQRTEAATRTRTAATVYPVLFASTAVVIGIMWDISWHRTIGRDTFWTPAHLCEYVGGLVAGLSCGWLIIRTSFFGTDADRASSVRFWHFFYGPTGAWVCVWGTFAMLTSAPFDDWWHNAYGLDVKILSPPHVVLGIGIIAIAVGAMLMAAADQNRRATTGDLGATPVLYAYAAGLVLLFVSIIWTENLVIVRMHQALFYKTAAAIFPMVLATTGRAAKLRWPATTIAAMYMIVVEAMILILPLFPGEPKLGPIWHNVTHMVPPQFPLLLIVPAFVVDLLLRRFPSGKNDWVASVAIGLAFLAVFFVTQWFFADFLQSPLSANRFFATNEYDYGTSPQSYQVRKLFVRDPALLRGMLWAALFSIVSTRFGLWRGEWLRRLMR